MSNLATLKPFLKGDDPRRNTTGLNKGSGWLKNELTEALHKIAEGSDNPYYVLLVKKMLVMAIKNGNEQIIRLIWNYLEGMPLQRTDITSGDKPIYLPSEVIKKNEPNNTPSDPETSGDRQTPIQSS